MYTDDGYSVDCGRFAPSPLVRNKKSSDKKDKVSAEKHKKKGL